ncbi:uncharacterized protein LOC122391391 isoform X2 [Amphibalanus amphitrite]|uniref:uncharacterized protein LOC122391391 isoform X2 n=1 Tax=Amphibalanus amphitrite TaxID=1232801 RepID=UPI001C8FF448|nr:uncharacterized protein LOC122391391 isoform X2 [Amphibalanus amphitrite]
MTMGKTYTGKSYSARRRRILQRVNEHLTVIEEEHAAENGLGVTDQGATRNDHEVLSSTTTEEYTAGPSFGEQSRGYDACSEEQACKESDIQLSMPSAEHGHAQLMSHEQQSSLNPGTDNRTGPSHISDIDETEDGQHAKMLREWAMKHGISHMAVTDLLHILSEVPVPGIPTSARTLLKTERCIDVKKKAGGDYFYFGIKETLQTIANHLEHTSSSMSTLSLQLNIDGLPLFRSSRTCLWPILFTVKEWQKEVFMAAVFGGTEKPASLTEFLADFVEEMKVLEASGIQVSSRNFKVLLTSVVCDAPARAFLKCVKGHSGYHSCERCDQAGRHIQNRMTFPDMGANVRNDHLFKQMQDEDHHTGISPLSVLNVGMVSCFPLDYMHLVCLGVMRKLVALWLQGPLLCRLPGHAVREISERLKGLYGSVPQDFGRRPRSLNEFRMWKAVEFRQILLYTGPVVLSGVLPKKNYHHFLLLSVAMRLLLSEKPTAEEIDYAEKLLRMFVVEFPALYGKENVVYNVHSLIHIADDARKFGGLDGISAFVFENFLKDLKKLVRKQHQVVPQIVRRVLEAQQVDSSLKGLESSVQGEHFSGPVPDECNGHYRQFTKLNGKLVLSIKDRDCYIECDGGIFKILNIIQDKSGEVKLVTDQFEKVGDQFSFPLPSSSLGIVHVRQGSKRMNVTDLKSISHKLWLMKDAHGVSIVVPLLHNA